MRYSHGSNSYLRGLNNLSARNQNDWSDIAVLENGYYDEALALFNKVQEPAKFASPDFSPSVLETSRSL